MLRAVGFVCRVCTHAVNGCAFVLIVVRCYVVSLCRVVRAVVLHIVDLVDLSSRVSNSWLCGVVHS